MEKLEEEKLEEEKLDDPSLHKDDSSSWPSDISGNDNLYVSQESQHLNNVTHQSPTESQNKSIIKNSSTYRNATDSSSMSNLNINNEIARRDAPNNADVRHNIQNEVSFLDQEWKDRSAVSKAGYVLANIFTLGGIVWGRKITSCCCKNSLKNVDCSSEILLD